MPVKNKLRYEFNCVCATIDDSADRLLRANLFYEWEYYRTAVFDYYKDWRAGRRFTDSRKFTPIVHTYTYICTWDLRNPCVSRSVDVKIYCDRREKRLGSSSQSSVQAHRRLIVFGVAILSIMSNTLHRTAETGDGNIVWRE